MLKWIARRRLAAFERAFGYDASYMHEMLDISWKGFIGYSRVAGLAAYREEVPLEAWYAAKLAGTLAEDCGPCTQLGVTMAEQDGVKPSILQAIVQGDEPAMGEDAALAWRFAHATLAHDPNADALREQIVARWGERALLSLAIGLAMSRVFPTVKYAMGHGKACSRIRVGQGEARPAIAAAKAASHYPA